MWKNKHFHYYYYSYLHSCLGCSTSHMFSSHSQKWDGGTTWIANMFCNRAPYSSECLVLLNSLAAEMRYDESNRVVQ